MAVATTHAHDLTWETMFPLKVEDDHVLVNSPSDVHPLQNLVPLTISQCTFQIL